MQAVQSILDNPEQEIEELNVDEIIKRQLHQLQTIKINQQGDIVDVLKIMINKEISFQTKTDYYAKKIKPRIDWIKFQDKKDIQKYLTSQEKISLLPSEEEEEYEPHRQPTVEQESSGALPKAIIYPFYGGYYKEGVFDYFDSTTLKWRKKEKQLSDFQPQNIEQDRQRVYQATAREGRPTPIILPYNWGVDSESIKWIGETPKNFQFHCDQNGIVYLFCQSEKTNQFSFQLKIGPSSDAAISDIPTEKLEIVEDILPQELVDYANEVSSSEKNITAARQICSFVKAHFEYDKDNYDLESYYKQDKGQYFLKMWEMKKAKCDEANTLVARILSKLGYKVKFVFGFSVQAKSEQNEAQLNENNGHAWIEVFDQEKQKWQRLDATPKGDPNINEEEQEAELGEGDFGEQEVELMSDKELEKILRELSKKEIEQSQAPEIVFSREAGCSPEQARKILQTIQNLREKYQKELNEASGYWARVLRENLAEISTYQGPVRQSEGEELDDVVMAGIEIKAGEKDPMGFEKEQKEVEKTKLFGGYEVYIMADMSGSMDWLLNGIKKSDAQRDMVFLFIDNIMSQAARARRIIRNLKAPMPIKVCLTVFGKKTEVVLPITDKWDAPEQLKVYLALDKGAKGGTPDNIALKMIEEQIQQSQKDEQVVYRKIKNNKPKMHRFVIATCDGGSDNYSLVKAANDRLQAQGIPVNLFLIGEKTDQNLLEAAKSTYQSVTPIVNIKELAKIGLDNLTARIKEIYNK